MSQPQDSSLMKMPPQNLQSNRQLFASLAARNGNPRNSRQIRSHRVDISQVHGQRILRLLAQAKRRRGTGRRDNRIHLPKGLIEILSEQRTNLLRLQVV